MGLRNMAIHTAVTTQPVMAGTALPLVSANVAIQNGIQLVCSSDTNFQTRRAVTAKSRPASYDAKTKKWTKSKCTLSFVIPTIDLSDNSVVYNTARFEVETHPSVDSTMVPMLLAMVQSAIKDSAVQPFLTLGTLD